jgi:hypothetical protein
MFITVLFRCTTSEEMNQEYAVHIYIMEFYSAIGNNDM